jgi:Mini-chromosome maintenance replisome factor
MQLWTRQLQMRIWLPVLLGSTAARSCRRGLDLQHARRAAPFPLQAYDDDEESLKLNEVVECVGVLSIVPELADLHAQAHRDRCAGASLPGNELLDEELAARPPTSLVGLQ